MNRTQNSVPRPSKEKLRQLREIMTTSGFSREDDPAAILAELSPWQNNGGPSNLERREVSLGDHQGWKLSTVVYKPPLLDQERPRVMFIHGGAWVLGNPASHDKLTRQIAALGFEVWSLDYPRAPRWPFPAALDSILNAIDILVSCNEQPIILAGDSAGGGLAASVALARPEVVAALALLYPVLDYRAGYPFFSKFYSHLDNGFIDPYLADLNETLDLEDWRINPLAHAADLPPTWVTVGEFDPLFSQSETLSNLLTRANITVQLFPAKNSGHAFMQDPDDKNVPGALASLGDFLQAIHGKLLSQQDESHTSERITS